MVDIKCDLGEPIRIDDEHILRVIAIRPDCVVLRLTSKDDRSDESRELTRTQERAEFRHSE